MKTQTLGEYLRQWRESKGIDQKMMSVLLSVSRPYVSFLEHDKYDYPVDGLKKYKKHMKPAEYKEACQILANKMMKDLE